MRRVLQRVVRPVQLARRDRRDLRPDRDHRVAEPVEFRLSTRFPSARSSACRRPARTWSAHESRNPAAAWRCPPPARPLRPAKPRQSMMHSCATIPPGPGIQDRISIAQPLRDVVGVQDRHLGRARQSGRAHHADIGIRDRQDQRAAERRRRHRPEPCRRPGIGSQRMVRQKRRQMRRHADRPDPGPPPPCGMQNVLCRFRWHTSAPIVAGEVSPTCAFMLAPSM